MKTSESISSGIDAIGQGGAGERSVAGGSGGMESFENSAMSSEMLGWRLCEGFCVEFGMEDPVLPAFGIAAAAALVDFGGKEDGGKCFNL